MEHRMKNVWARFLAGLLRIPARLVGAVAVIVTIAVGASLAAVPAGAAVVHQPASSAVRMAEAVAFVRAHDSVLAHASNQKIETLIIGMTKNVIETKPTTSRHTGIGADILGVSKTGDTLWFNKGVVAVWAIASTALILASLEYWGVEIGVAYEYVHLLFDVLYSATVGHRCAWFTYNSPRSLGTYSC